MKTPNPNAETNEGILTSGVHQLNPKKETGVEPHADDNILKVTDYCLYALTSTDRDSTGRGSRAWWFILIMVFLIEVYIYTVLHLLLNGTYQEALGEYTLFWGGRFLVFIIFTIPFFILWRRVLPICFNRTTKTISSWHKGKLYQANWDTLEAFAKTMIIVGPHVPYKQGVVAINLYHKTERLDVPIAGTKHRSKTHQEASYMAWEYIRLFMEEGKKSIPESEFLNIAKTSNLKKVWSENIPFPPKGSGTIVTIFYIILLPYIILGAFISIPTDLIYIGLDKILPKRQSPKELLVACEAGKQ